jgi:large subunit ribosomal protein L29
MGNKKYEAVEAMSTEEIKEQINEVSTRLVKIKFNHAVSPVEDTSQLSKTRRHIARLKTELKKRNAK